MRMTVEREIRVGNTYYGTVYSVAAGKVGPNDPFDAMNRVEKAVTVEYAVRIRLAYNELRNAGASRDDIRKRVKAL